MSDQATPVESMNAEQAQGEISRLRDDEAFQKDLMSGFGIGHREALNTWRNLQQKAFSSGEQPAAGQEPAATHTRGESEFSKKLEGVLDAPAAPSDYKITRDQSIADWDAELETEAKTLAHAIGLSNGALEGVVLAWNGAMKQGGISDEQLGKQYDETVSSLNRKHGDGAAVVEKANSVLRALPHAQRERTLNMLRTSGLCNSPYVIEQLAMLADRKAAKR